MKIRIATLVLLAACLGFWIVYLQSDNVACWSALVVDDETGLPLPNVTVEASFRNDNGWEVWTKSARPNRERNQTNEKGACRLFGKTNIGRAGCWVQQAPSGYYRAGGRSFHFERKSFFGTWQPENLVVTIRLQRVEHPIPLRVKNVGGDLQQSTALAYCQRTNEVMRYDLVKGDYLPPNGKGEVADLEVNARLMNVEEMNMGSWVQQFFDYENTISFSGDGNGMIPLMTNPTDGIRLRTAPTEGYVKACTLRCGIRKKLVPPNVYGVKFAETDPYRCYYFRIRSRYGADGKLISAYYGKIYGDFKFRYSIKKGCKTEFLYYLNPTPLDTNLEWDCKTNLNPTPGYMNEFLP